MEGSKMKEYDIEPGQEWEIDLFRPEDGDGVVRLFLSVYGKGYPVNTYIDRGLLIDENAAGRIISSVARTSKGDIVGHDALFCSAPCDRIREAGAGVVHASYRGGKGIFGRLVAHAMETGAKRFGVEAVYGESVCNHVFSQKMTQKLGWITQAIEVDLMPASAYEMEGSATGRVSSLFDCITLQSKPHSVFIPSCYEDALRFIYSGLDDSREILVGQGKPAPGSTTRMEVQYFDFAQVGRMAVREPGADFMQTFEAEEKKIAGRGGIVFQVWLNLACPGIGVAVDALRQRGYFLGGVLPRWFDTDGLLMQRIAKTPNWDSIQVQFDRAKRILDLVKEDWKRT
ncbi:MAG: hypothetical protein C4530_11380 [Desulfobacteraceae bacterium]|nr:MAG: hypothetical protein C4530_11380 [Desulfobacteraceae bacterium]